MMVYFGYINSTPLPITSLTPTLFAQYAESLFTPFFNNNNLSLSVHDKTWAASLGMNSFLSVARGSDEEPKFLEIAYKGNGNGTGMTALVGKGVTFDSGGISIKPSANMDMMKGDMMGASVVLST